MSVAGLIAMYAVPYLLPYSSVLQSCDMQTGVRLYAVPLKTPYIALNAMIEPAPPPGSHRPRIVIAQGRLLSIMTLNLPQWSASQPGKRRPMTAAALMMARSWYAKVLLMPLDNAYVVIYAPGIRQAKSMANMAPRVKRKRRSVKLWKLAFQLMTCDGGRRVFIKRIASKPENIPMKPMIRIVQGKPTCGTSLSNKMGKMMPPTGPAVVTMPVAIPRRFENQCPTVARLLIHMQEEDKPPRIPTLSMN